MELDEITDFIPCQTCCVGAFRFACRLDPAQALRLLDTIYYKIISIRGKGAMRPRERLARRCIWHRWVYRNVHQRGRSTMELDETSLALIEHAKSLRRSGSRFGPSVES